jgi:hypothetical protein
MYPARRVRIGPREKFQGLIFWPWVHGAPSRDAFHRTMGSIERWGLNMPAIMSLEEPRPRGTVVGERADRRRVSEAENFFRCDICGGYLDARDYVWVLDHEGPLPHPAQDQAQ